MDKKKRGIKFDFNAPVILGMTALSFVLWLLNTATGGVVNGLLAIRFTSWLDPLMYLRLFTHVLAHANIAHFAGNFMLILAVGPLVEEKYGSKKLLWMIAVTAVVTGLVNILFFKNVALIGASGIVFMLILLASFVNIRQGHIPVTVILVGVLYIGNEIAGAVTTTDNISRMAHIAGGLCGAVFGYRMNVHKGSKK